MSETFPRYYVSPYSGRVIKSTGKTYQFYKDNGYIMEKHKCFYNVKSAKKCLEKIVTLYPALQFPSTFMNIPKTYESGLARGFVQDANEHVTAFVDKKGALNKLQNPIQIVQRIIIKVEDPLQALPAVLKTKQPVNTETQRSIETQLKQSFPLTPDIALVYNPVQNDFIPKTQEMTKEEMLSAIDTINRDLVPEGLPPISKATGELAGIIQDPTTSNVVGVVDTQNQIKLFDSKPTNGVTETDAQITTPAQSESTQTESTQTESTQTETDAQITTPAQSESTPTESTQTETDAQITTPAQTESTPTESTQTDAQITTPAQSESTQTESTQTESTQTDAQITTPAQSESTQTESTQTETDAQITTPAQAETESTQSESTQSETDGTLPASIVTSVPSLVIDTDKIDSAVVMSPKETAEVIKELNCLSGEQFDVSEQRCLPCTHYNLIWDPIYKKCKAMIKSDIKSIVLNGQGSVLGYT